MTERKLPDPETVERLYWDEGLKQKEIAERYGCTLTAVSRYMKRHGIERRSRSEAALKGNEHPEWIPEKEILDDIIAGRILLGDWPSSYEYKKFGEYSAPSIARKSGGFPQARERAKERFEATREEWPVEVEPRTQEDYRCPECGRTKPSYPVGGGEPVCSGCGVEYPVPITIGDGP